MFDGIIKSPIYCIMNMNRDFLRNHHLFSIPKCEKKRYLYCSLIVLMLQYTTLFCILHLSLGFHPGKELVFSGGYDMLKGD